MRLTPLGRGLVGRCPECGSGGIFASLNDLVGSCPRCGTNFEREEGYWLGAMVVSMATVLLSFLLIFVGTMLVTWPDVPWTAVLVVTVVVNGLIPLVGYGWAKTTWMGIDRAFNPSSVSETAEAMTVRSARDPDVS